MRFTYCALLLALVALSPASYAQTAPAPTAPAAAEKYTVADTDVGTLLDNPDTKAILAKYLPELISSPQIDMARSMTLQSMQSYAPDKLSDATLAKIDVELAKIPVKK